MENKKTKDEYVRNEYKEVKYGIYHNVLIDILGVIACSAEPQEKIDIIQEKIVNARSECTVEGYKISNEKGLLNDSE